MGSMYGWHCKDCGAGESFNTGGGFLSINRSDVVERAESGAFGPAMKALLGDGLPEGWDTFSETVYYRCPDCGGFMPGERIKIEDQSGNWLFFHVKPEACPSCGSESAPWGDDKAGVSSDELMSACMEHVENGCPKCGGKKVYPAFGHWD